MGDRTGHTGWSQRRHHHPIPQTGARPTSALQARARSGRWYTSLSGVDEVVNARVDGYVGRGGAIEVAEVHAAAKHAAQDK